VAPLFWPTLCTAPKSEIGAEQWRRQDSVTGGSEVWVYRGSRIRSPPEADTFTAVHREFVGFGTVRVPSVL